VRITAQNCAIETVHGAAWRNTLRHDEGAPKGKAIAQNARHAFLPYGASWRKTHQAGHNQAWNPNINGAGLT
jgi:hypothetical protein